MRIIDKYISNENACCVVGCYLCGVQSAHVATTTPSLAITSAPHAVLNFYLRSCEEQWHRPFFSQEALLQLVLAFRFCRKGKQKGANGSLNGIERMALNQMIVLGSCSPSWQQGRQRMGMSLERMRRM